MPRPLHARTVRRIIELAPSHTAAEIAQKCAVAKQTVFNVLGKRGLKSLTASRPAVAKPGLNKPSGPPIGDHYPRQQDEAYVEACVAAGGFTRETFWRIAA